jgi:tRNA1Val (adenine37-N6)-methyltransferase
MQINMSNDYFQFRQFTVRQSRCAMKVGTDGTLLGAWASLPESPCHVLDLGTGTGLIALMLAQRFPQASVTAIDIDGEAVLQAQENVLLSPFADRIEVMEADANLFSPQQSFDAIVSNPPYFEQSLECPDQQRTLARHTASLTYTALVQTAFRLLNDQGTFSVVIPADSRSRMESETLLAGFFLSRRCDVRTTPRKPIKRCLIEFSKQPISEYHTEETVIEKSPGVRSLWYRRLTDEFYIK